MRGRNLDIRTLLSHHGVANNDSQPKHRAGLVFWKPQRPGEKQNDMQEAWSTGRKYRN